MNQEQANSRIARNTLFLYIRMAMVMVVSLYTSRVLFNALGEVDYGLNNVIAGVVILFSYLNNSLSAASSRFITYKLGQNDMKDVSNVFYNSFFIHLTLALIVLIAGETIGIYVVNHVLTIPENRILACNWAFQMVVWSSVLTITKVPFSALIFSYEKMNIIAFVGVFEAISKLVIALSIMITSYDKLIFLSILNFCISCLMWLFYLLYCFYKNKEIVCCFMKPCKVLIKEMLGFTVWSLLGSTAIMFKKQGINILINIFFGSVVNAANAIAITVNHAVSNFASNFMAAFEPQIIKSYASKEYIRTRKLLFVSGKFSFFLLMFLCFPLIFEADFVLRLWLGTYPKEARLFTQLILVLSLIEVFSYSIGTAFQANGEIRNMQLVTSMISLLIFPISYLLYKISFPACTAFYVMISISLLINIIYLYFIKSMLRISPRDYARYVYAPCIVVALFCIPIPYLMTHIMCDGFLRFFLILSVMLLIDIPVIYYVGLSESEKKYVVQFFKDKIQ